MKRRPLIITTDQGAAIASAVAAFSAALAAWFSYWQTRDALTLEMKREWTGLASMRDSFWEAIREAYVRFKAEKNLSYRSVEGLIGAAGVPDTVPPPDGKELRLWVRENQNNTKGDQVPILEFALRIYPEKRENDVKTPYIKEEYRLAFDKARNKLAHFWDDWVPLFRMCRLQKTYDRARDEVILLTWLEIALQQQTQAPGRGKIGLFNFASTMAGGDRSLTGRLRRKLCR